MPQGITRFGTLEGASQSRIVRLVGDAGLLLEPNEQPLISLLLQIKKKTPVDSPRFEWYEDDFMARWATNAGVTVTNTTASNTITLDDGTKAIAGDVWAIPNAVSSSTAPELVLVTSVSGAVATVTRAFAGSTITTIAPGDSLTRLGPAFAEGFSVPGTRYTKPSAKITYTEIFSHVFDITNTAIATKMYANEGKGERRYQHEKLLKEMKVSMNRSFLWGKAYEDLTGSQALRTTMGLNTVISSNVTSAGGTLTTATFESWARSVFRYSGDKPKILLACPLLISALNSWANSKLYIEPEEEVYGVRLRRFHTGHGTFLLVRDWMLEDGVAGKNGFGGWAFAIDPDEVEVIYLNGNGENRDIKVIENAVMDGADRKVDQAVGELGLVIRHEKKHGKLYNITGWS